MAYQRRHPADPQQCRQADIHGWRSTFKTWAEEQTGYDSKLIEVQSGRGFTRNKAEAVYMRGEMLDKRLALLRDWEDYLHG